MTDTLGDDLLHGVKAIAAYIGESERRTFYLLERNMLPATKLGARWVSRKSAIAKRFDLDGDQRETCNAA